MDTYDVAICLSNGRRRLINWMSPHLRLSSGALTNTKNCAQSAGILLHNTLSFINTIVYPQ